MNFTTMLKLLFTLFAYITVLNAGSIRKVTFTSGNITQGKNATGVSVKTNNGHQEIVWLENQNNLKGTVKIIYPITYTFETTKAERCGPFISTLHVMKNNQEDSNETPLLVRAMFRGTLTGNDC
ncbi:uncharacterized protein LOC127288370 isoform X2 [Leptopilina boulardi]|uniref:uncharacterized protein LOC127288370 isoform X2 n=1 Tax=Leptopilina boulardi TaxID=63433 RepID=UPI0021F61B1C|nr:uncharacterized protein LOC127288370 isoform X2 [Leptopilina boulardi]